MSSPPRRLSRLLRPFFSRMPLGRREEAADGQTARTDCKSSTRSPFVFETLEPRLLLAGDALGLAVAYAFDETSGTTAADATSHAIVATLINGPTWTTGQHGNAVNLDGINDYLTVPNSPSLDISGIGLTQSMWINPQALSGGDSVVLGKFWNPTMTSPYYQYGLELAGGTVPVFYIGTTGGPLSASMGSALPLNQWSYLAVVFDGSQAQFYVNGALITTASLPATITARGNPLQLGADNNLAQFFKGSLDDVRIYDRFLTQAEIQTDMVTSLGAPDTIAPTVQAINRVGLTPTNAGSVQWTVTFSESVTGVDITDFQLAPSGVTGAALTSVTPVSGTTYTVTASTGTGSGTLG